jgi:hypothetical protein
MISREQIDHEGTAFIKMIEQKVLTGAGDGHAPCKKQGNQ